MKNQEEINTGFVTLDIKPASVNLNENTGADGTILYYVDAGKIILVALMDYLSMTKIPEQLYSR